MQIYVCLSAVAIKRLCFTAFSIYFKMETLRALILFIQTLALYKSFTCLLTYLLN